MKIDLSQFAGAAESIATIAKKLRDGANESGEDLTRPPASAAELEAWTAVEAAIFLEAAQTLLTAPRTAADDPSKLGPALFTGCLLRSVSRSFLTVRGHLDAAAAFAAGVCWAETDRPPSALELHASAASATVEDLDQAMRRLDEASDVWTDEAAARWFAARSSFHVTGG